MHERVHKNGLENHACSCHLVNSHAFYKEWIDILMKCVVIVNHKCLFVGFSTIEKWNKCLKNLTPGMVPWYDLTMPWKKIDKVLLMSSCTPFINWTSTKEVPCFREGKSPRLKGNPNFRPSLSFSVFPTINIPPQMQRVQIWHFPELIYHIKGIVCIF